MYVRRKQMSKTKFIVGAVTDVGLQRVNNRGQLFCSDNTRQIA